MTFGPGRGDERHRTLGLVTDWYPSYGHPQRAEQPSGVGIEPRPWFRHDNDMLYAADGHPDLELGASCYRLAEDKVYPIEGGPAWFEIVGSFMYPAEAHPAGWSVQPWYQRR